MKVHSFSILFLFCGCISKKTNQPVWGVFTTYKPSYIDQVFIERNYGARVYPLPAVMFFLRKNDTYVFGFCDNQISEAGRYAVKGNSILFYDRFVLDKRMDVDSIYVYHEKKSDLLYIIAHRTDSNGKASKKVIPLKRNNNSAHLGFLRGQEMELDSIIHFYKQHSVDEQNKWTDSVIQHLGKN